LARRFLEQTLYTGRIAYLHAKGLVELDFPVLVRPVDERYNYVVAQWPIEDEGGLFYRVWQPTTAMHIAARGVFGEDYTGRQPELSDDQRIWDAVRRVHRSASFAHPDARARGKDVVGRVAEKLTQKYGENVPPVSFAVVSEVYRAWEALVFPNPMAASFASAALLLMYGVPRERIAIFGMYYQDPTTYYRQNSDWRAGFMSGTPYYTVMGVYVNNQWTAVDFTVLASGPHKRLAPTPHAHVRPADLGKHPQDGAPLVIDFAHPYTMIFAPPGPRANNDSPLLSRIPLLQVYGSSSH
jgi:hypothetical protein